jgi:hypothetical protein
MHKRDKYHLLYGIFHGSSHHFSWIKPPLSHRQVGELQCQTCLAFDIAKSPEHGWSPAEVEPAMKITVISWRDLMGISWRENGERSSTHLGIPSDVSSAPLDNPPLIFCQFSHENTKKNWGIQRIFQLDTIDYQRVPLAHTLPMRNRGSLWEPYGNGVTRIIGGTRKEFQQQIVIL